MVYGIWGYLGLYKNAGSPHISLEIHILIFYQVFLWLVYCSSCWKLHTFPTAAGPLPTAQLFRELDENYGLLHVLQQSLGVKVSYLLGRLVKDVFQPRKVQ